jgi:hypothetical protein
MTDFFPWLVQAAARQERNNAPWQVAVRLDSVLWQWRAPWHRAGRLAWAWRQRGRRLWILALLAGGCSAMATAGVMVFLSGVTWRETPWILVWMSAGLACFGWALFQGIRGRIQAPATVQVWHVLPVSTEGVHERFGRLEEACSEAAREVLADAVDITVRLGQGRVGLPALWAALAARPQGAGWLQAQGAAAPGLEAWLRDGLAAPKSALVADGWHASVQAALVGAGLSASAHGSRRVEAADLFVAACAASEAFGLPTPWADGSWADLGARVRNEAYPPRSAAYPFAVRRVYDRSPL